MPELSSIQTYEIIDRVNYRITLDRFCHVLKNLDLWNNEIKEAFDCFEWKIEDDGFIYSSTTSLDYLTSRLSDIKIRPHIMVYTPKIGEGFKDQWISCELLIKTQDLINPENGEFHENTYKLVKSLMQEMQKEFKQTGIYFTDEMQDGSAFEGVLLKEIKKLWEFDYALIPTSLERLYSKKPKTHAIKKHGNTFEAWYVDRWRDQNVH